MYIKRYQFLILIFAKISFALDRGDTCITPNEDKGICLPGLSCKVIANAVSTNNKSAIIFAKKSQCGYDTEPLFCCGASGFFVKPHIDEPPFPEIIECGFEDPGPNIIGGNVTELNEYPWVAALEFKNRYTGEHSGIKCGGSLISNRYVLTAAHCLLHIEFEVVNVWLGDWDLTTDPDCKRFITTTECADPVLIIKANKTIYHPEYVSKTHTNDIGLIRLESYVTYTKYIRPICLKFDNLRTFQLLNINVTAVGWGITETGFISNLKLKVDLPLISNEECMHDISDTQLCAGGEAGKDACQGDSGGPLMRLLKNTTRRDHQQRWYLEAIVSWGIGCGQKNVPGVYTWVPPYVNWIEKVIEAEES